MSSGAHSEHRYLDYLAANIYSWIFLGSRGFFLALCIFRAFLVSLFPKLNVDLGLGSQEVSQAPPFRPDASGISKGASEECDSQQSTVALLPTWSQVSVTCRGTTQGAGSRRLGSTPHRAKTP